LRLPIDSTLAKTTNEAPTIVFTNCIDPGLVRKLQHKGVTVFPVERGGRNLEAVLHELYKLDIQSVLVEGGTGVAGAVVDAGLVDKVTLLYAPLIIGGSEAPAAVGGKGVTTLAEALRLEDVSITRFGSDIEITGYPAG
jgi:diaminohydroxyphosphoribosylaminopyrimidine deaminase/5-amino-6-(5-phosphoribosylamino)uracil reductase